MEKTSGSTMILKFNLKLMDENSRCHNCNNKMGRIEALNNFRELTCLRCNLVFDIWYDGNDRTGFVYRYCERLNTFFKWKIDNTSKITHCHIVNQKGAFMFDLPFIPSLTMDDQFLEEKLLKVLEAEEKKEHDFYCANCMKKVEVKTDKCIECNGVVYEKYYKGAKKYQEA